MPRKKQPVTRSEALDLLSAQLRTPNIAPNALIKLVGLYSKLANWRASPEPQDDDVNRLVVAAERKGRNEIQ